MNTNDTQFENDIELSSLDRYLSDVGNSLPRYNVTQLPLVRNNSKKGLYATLSPLTLLTTRYKNFTVAALLVAVTGFSGSVLITRTAKKVNDVSVLPTELNSRGSAEIQSDSIMSVGSSSAASVVNQVVNQTINDLLAEDNEALATIDTLSNVAVDELVNNVNTMYEI